MKKNLPILVAMMLAASAVTGCGNTCDGLGAAEDCDDGQATECELLQEKLEVCFPDQTSGGGETAECTEPLQIQAACLSDGLDATCSNLAAVATECAN